MGFNSGFKGLNTSRYSDKKKYQRKEGRREDKKEILIINTND